MLTLILSQYDTDGNGTIDFNEFIALSVALNSQALSGSEQAMAQLFAKMDADGNRSLDTKMCL